MERQLTGKIKPLDFENRRRLYEKHGGRGDRALMFDFRERYSKAYAKLCRRAAKLGLKNGHPSIQMLYEYLFFDIVDDSCKTCGAKVGWHRNNKRPRDYCSGKCRNACPEYQANVMASMIERHGGCGAASRSIARKIRRTTKQRYGDADWMKTDEFKKRRRAASLERYGVEDPNQCPEIARRAILGSCRVKKVKIDGRTFRVRGFEDAALKWLHEHGVRALSTKLPMFDYEHEGKMRRYLPDIQGRRRGKRYIFEVKSTYTLERDWSVNEAKFNRMNEEFGNSFALLVVRGDGSVHKVHQPTLEKCESLFFSKVRA